MFGLGMGEILLIAIVALLVLGPERLPGAAKAIGKGIRDLRKQTKELGTMVEEDTELGAAVRDLRSAMRGDPEQLYEKVTGDKWNDDKPAANTPPLFDEHGHPLDEEGHRVDGFGRRLDANGVPIEHQLETETSAAENEEQVASKEDASEEVASEEVAEVDPDLPVIRPSEGSLSREPKKKTESDV